MGNLWPSSSETPEGMKGMYRSLYSEGVSAVTNGNTCCIAICIESRAFYYRRLHFVVSLFANKRRNELK